MTCAKNIRTSTKKALKTRSDSWKNARRICSVATIFMYASVLLGILLAFVLIVQLLISIRKLTYKTAPSEGPKRPGDEVKTLNRQVHGLVKDIDTTRKELEQSQERFFHSEKMALLGKLSVEAAHSIRNPMTSIKMRLFSLERNLNLSQKQKEVFKVVAEEMRHLDNIVSNFLEFFKPSKLRKQIVNMSDIVDMTLSFLRHRLQLEEIEVNAGRKSFCPCVDADPELLKGVFINLAVNACEAMDKGGRLVTSEEEAASEVIGRAASTDAMVIIRGESETGKELVARALYQHSRRNHKSFVIVNCVAIPETLLESGLFGYEKGAFTGAANRRVGKIEQADGGTIFFDEIGDMPLSI